MTMPAMPAPLQELKQLMDGLSVKVFRTYNASITLDRLLAEMEADGSISAMSSTMVEAKKADYDRWVLGVLGVLTEVCCRCAGPGAGAGCCCLTCGLAPLVQHGSSLLSEPLQHIPSSSSYSAVRRSLPWP